MRSVINVLIAVDTQSILARFVDPSQNPQRPTHLTGDLCLILAQPARADSVCSGPHLAFAAPVGTALRWRALPIERSAGHGIVLYNVEPLRAVSVMTGAVPVLTSRCAPLPVLDNGRNTMPPTFIPTPRPDHYLAAEIADKGEAAVRVRFLLTTTDPDSGAPQLAGYFEWRATITVE